MTSHRSPYMSSYIKVLILLYVTSCASYKLNEGQSNLRASFSTTNYQQTAQMLQKMKRKNIYRDKDEVLYLLELGTVHHFEGTWQQSIQAFEQAERKIDDNFTKSISRGALSLLGNDNQLIYDGEVYEDIYINAFKALNFLHQKKLDGATVEAKRIAYKLQNLNIRFRGLADALNRNNKDTTHYEVKKVNIQDSPFSRYLATILYTKQGAFDDARIEFQQLKQAFQEHNVAFNTEQPRRNQYANITNPDSFNVVVTAFAGRAPYKTSENIRLYNDGLKSWVKFSFPDMKKITSLVHGVGIFVGSEKIGDLFLLERIDNVVKEIFDAKKPVIYARALARATSKLVATKALEKQAKKEDDTVGDIVGIFGQIYREASENADLRAWQTLPGNVFAGTFNLPEGNHTIRLEYYDASGILLQSVVREIEIGSGTNELNLVEALLWK